ncbi:hypothetical protein L596_024453 [Steinernema carpocapsae]|uniref:Uncharacterized protein n=1 Tax=Steinernema carpocapsae TaxID=34508 RepID=A0A4U5MHN6_STECR|nr:hypothetical protein L596_024453 [Steinernema carpocapsae]
MTNKQSSFMHTKSREDIGNTYRSWGPWQHGGRAPRGSAASGSVRVPLGGPRSLCTPSSDHFECGQVAPSFSISSSLLSVNKHQPAAATIWKKQVLPLWESE